MASQSDSNLQFFAEYVPLLKRPVVAEPVVSEFERHREHFIYIPVTINSSPVENQQRWRYSFGT